uniref:Glycine N-acyltransferase-like protein n=1 Tax=Propithecus coquereli TaxID=379532 RepID=A0A2K6EWG9_PROCO
MLLLNNSQKLLTLNKSLARSIPESLKVRVHHGNPFNMEVLVDSWPEYQMEMTDDMDPYVNTYCVFSKVPQKLQKVLENSEVINWRQIFHIQGCQESLGEEITAVTFSKSVRINHLKAVLCINEDILRLNAGSWCEVEHGDDEFESDDPNFKISQLDISHAGLINASWRPGRNEKSPHFIQRCLQKLPAYCMLGPGGVPVSWIIMDSSCELRMAYAVERYRSKGKVTQVLEHYAKYLGQKNIPFSLSVLEENEKSNRIVMRFGLFAAACGWHSWICYPQKLVPF